MSPFARALDSAIASAGTEESTASTDSRFASCVQRESAGGGEAIEHATARVAFGGDVILALIEKNAGLLAVQQVGFELQAVHLAPRRAPEFRQPDTSDSAARPSSLRTLASLRARMPAREQLFQTMRDDVARAIHALARASASPGTRP